MTRQRRRKARGEKKNKKKGRWTNGKKGDRHHHGPGFQPTSGTGRRSSVTVSVGRPKPCEGNWVEETEGSPRVECVCTIENRNKWYLQA